VVHRLSDDDPTAASHRLTPAALHVLLALADQDRHGLGIADHIEAFTHGSMSLGPGSLYGTIKRLLGQHLIADVPARPDGSPDPRRRYYRLTASGRRALEAHTRDLATVLGIARLKRVIR